jgi:hypothetical protein
MDQQVGDERCVKRPGTDRNEVGILEGGERFLEGTATAWDNVQALDGNCSFVDARFAIDDVAIGLFCL